MFTNNWFTKGCVDYILGFVSEIAKEGAANLYKDTSGWVTPAKTVTYNRIDTLMKTFLTEDCKGHTTSAATAIGVAFGSGTVAPTVEDNTLSGTQHTWINTSNTTLEFSYGEDGDDIVLTCVYTINNNSGADATIGEVGLFSYAYGKPGASSSSKGYVPTLIERTLLDVPITIPADGVGKVTYTIRRSYAE